MFVLVDLVIYDYIFAFTEKLRRFSRLLKIFLLFHFVGVQRID